MSCCRILSDFTTNLLSLSLQYVSYYWVFLYLLIMTLEILVTYYNYR
eukprot:UN21386